MDATVGYIQSFSLHGKREKLYFPVIAAATILVCTAAYRLFKYETRTKEIHSKQKLKEIPVPGSAYPYFGHMLSMGESPSATIAQWHAQLGPLIKLRMGVHHWVIVDDPILAHKIFVTRGTETSYRPHSAFAYYHYSLQGKGIGFAQPNAGFKEARSAVLSVLAPKQIETYMDSIHEKADTLVSQLIESTDGGQGVTPRMNLELYSLNVIASACFGKKYESIHDPQFIKLAELIVESMKYAGLENDLPNFLPAFAIFDYFAGTQEKMKQFIKTRRDPMCKELIEFAMEQEGPNVVKSFQENGFNLSQDDLTVMMFDLIGGGTDTIAITLSWNIVLMCCFPQVQRKAAAEVDEFVRLNGRLPVFSERLQLPYCIAVIKECLRFRPTTSFGIPHAVYDDVIVDDYIIPKGSTLITSMISLHKNPELYPDPERFYPERFLTNLKTMQASANGKLEDRDHFNFGWGR
ncbi:unnamed protein product [Mucor hiemalis]